MDALRERQKAIRAALVENRRAMRIAEKAEEERRAKIWRITPWLRNVIMILYLLASYSKEPVFKYLATVARRRKWPPLKDEEVGRAVDDLFLEISMEELMALADKDKPTDPSAMREASRVYEEWRLAKWAERLNLERGLAPTTAMVLEQYRDNREQVPEAARPRYCGVAAEAGARMWAWRWRQRWGGRYGSIPTKENVPLGDRRAKV